MSVLNPGSPQPKRGVSHKNNGTVDGQNPATTKDDDYPIVYRVLTIPGGAGFCPSTVPAALTCCKGAKMAVNSPGKTHDSDMNKRHCHANDMCLKKRETKTHDFGGSKQV